MSAQCDGHLRENSFSVILSGRLHQFDSFQSAIGALAACGIIRNDDEDLDFEVADDDIVFESVVLENKS